MRTNTCGMSTTQRHHPLISSSMVHLIVSSSLFFRFIPSPSPPHDLQVQCLLNSPVLCISQHHTLIHNFINAMHNNAQSRPQTVHLMQVPVGAQAAFCCTLYCAFPQEPHTANPAFWKEKDGRSLVDRAIVITTTAVDQLSVCPLH